MPRCPTTCQQTHVNFAFPLSPTQQTNNAENKETNKKMQQFSIVGTYSCPKTSLLQLILCMAEAVWHLVYS